MEMNIAFVIWRESFEAFLIVGILVSAVRNWEQAQHPKRYVAGGVFLGVLMSLALAYFFQHAQTELEGLALEYFDVGMMILAAALMTHMCAWMRKHAPSLKREIEAEVRAVSRTRLIGLSTVAALAVAREGAEIVVFLFGMHSEAGETAARAQSFWMAVAAGVVLTGASAWAYVRGLRFFKPRVFFRVTTVFLLMTACALFLSAVRKLIQMDVLSPLGESTVWDTSALLDERSGLGQLVSAMTGYESAPSPAIVLALLAFWAAAGALFWGLNRGQKTVALR
jgi:high-affinity iron transporter